MPNKPSNPRRSYGTGSIIEKNGAYYGRWRVGGRQVKRKLGSIRNPGTREGLTRSQAEAKLRKLIGEVTYTPQEGRLTFEDVAQRYLHHVEHVKQRKSSTVQDYRIMVRRHVVPYFEMVGKPVDKIIADDVAGYMVLKGRQGYATKTISNHLTFIHGVFGFALKRGLVPGNPVAVVDRPAANEVDADFRYLDIEQLEAIIRATPNDDRGPLDAALYLTAAMTGLRQGELAAIRWRDVDWSAGVIRVRQTFSRNEWGKPKSRRAVRAVPMADRVAGELERHFQRSAYQDDGDLVFCHPHTGNPYDAKKMRDRFYDAMKAAGLKDLVGRENGITFHSLRHTFGTRMAAVGVPMRTLQEWMGHRDHDTTLIYADYAPDASQGASFAALAFGTGHNLGHILKTTEHNSDPLKPHRNAESE